MKRGNMAKLFVSIGLMAAIAVAIIVYSLSWFSATNVIVTARSASFTASQGDSFFIDINTPDEEYERYMGETGIEYNGVDHPYYLIYSPFEIKMSLVTPDSDLCFTYKMVETSYVQLATDSEPSMYLKKELMANSFSMELHAIEYDEENDEYNETGENYRSENGYFRNITTGEIFQLKEGQSRLFSLYLFFQGDVGLRLLASTQNNIDQKYKFVFSDPKYMFAYFEIKSLFSMDKLHTLTFETIGFNLDDPSTTSLIANTYNKLNASNYYSFDYNVPTSGFSLEGLDGTSADWPIAEVFDSEAMTKVATNVYFKEWVVRDFERDEDDPSDYGEYSYLTYRNTATSDSSVKYLWIDPLREERETLYATYGNSYEITLDYNDEVTDPSVAYIRPDSYYYSEGGHIHSEGSGLTFYNPYASSTPSTTSTVGITDSFTVPAREGYRFLGWSTSSNSLVSPFVNNNYTPTSDTTLYGIWQRVINVTFNVPTTWGNNYATIDGIQISTGSGASAVNYSVTNGSLTLPIAKGTSAYTALSAYTATATAHISSTNRALTLKGWYYESGGQWVKLTSSNTFTLDDDVTFVAVWNERSTYTITLDLYVNVDVSPGHNWYGQFSINSINNVDVGYTVLYNNSTTGTFSQNSNSAPCVSVTNVPEGVKLSDLNIDSVSRAGASALYISYVFDEWQTTNNNISTTITLYHGTAANMNDTITANRTLYAMCKSKLG